MKRWKLRESEYDEADGLSYVEISTYLGAFCGYSFLHPDDEDIASEFMGCEIAELRAINSYLKEEIRVLKIKLETLNDLLTNYKQMKYYSPHRKEIKMLATKIIDLEDKIKEDEDRIQCYKNLIKYRIDNHRAECESFDKKVETIKKKLEIED